MNSLWIFIFSFTLFMHCQGEQNYVLLKTINSQIHKYQMYKDLEIMHMKVPQDVLKASFHFRCYEDSNCDSKHVTVYVKPNSFPVINPDGSRFPSTFVNFSRGYIHKLEFKSDNKTNIINITGPEPTIYFFAAFLSYTDPRNDKIQQQGLRKVCKSVLIADFYVMHTVNVILMQHEDVRINLTSNSNTAYKFYVPNNIDRVFIKFSPASDCKGCENISIKVQSDDSPLISYESILRNMKFNNNYFARLSCVENSWYHIYFSEIKFNVSFNVQLKYFNDSLPDVLKTKIYGNNNTDNYSTFKYCQNSVDALLFREYNLIQFGKTESFKYEYDIQPITTDKFYPLFFNVSNNYVTTLKFEINTPMDIGGTLSLRFSIAPDKYKIGYKTQQHSIIVFCMRKSVREIPTWPSKCIYDDQENKPIMVLNGTKKSNIVHIPFPEIGKWYITIKLFCNETCNVCPCTRSCKRNFQNCMLNCDSQCLNTNTCDDCNSNCKTSLLKISDCKSCSCLHNCNVDLGKCVDSIVFSLNSAPCIDGSCAKMGSCSHILSEGISYTTCTCKNGYRGWDCSDGSLVETQFMTLIAILLLTLSNLFFIPTIYFAFISDYVVESIIYSFTMMYSILYHTCDTNANSNFCILPLGVLQFCDFYCGLLSIWVTLVAMSYLPTRITSILHICGAILLACATSLDKEALWVFLVPVIIGITIFITIWMLKCIRRKQLYPAKKYLTIFFPIGVCIAGLGLIIYAFLQTKSNYKYLHSFWHICIALSVLFLLPKKDYLE